MCGRVVMSVWIDGSRCSPRGQPRLSGLERFEENRVRAKAGALCAAGKAAPRQNEETRIAHALAAERASELSPL
jgi:hypothetical protein